MFFCTSISVPLLWQVITTLHMLVHSSMLWPCHWLIQAGARHCRASLSSILLLLLLLLYCCTCVCCTISHSVMHILHCCILIVGLAGVHSSLQCAPTLLFFFKKNSGAGPCARLCYDPENKRRSLFMNKH